MEEAIKKAIEGGWQGLEFMDKVEVEKGLKYPLYGRVWGTSKEGEGHGTQFAFLVLDPKFWQALGKALGWYSEKPLYQINNQPAQWAYYWHCFIDHLAEGKDAESFFQNLLNQTNKI